MKKVTVVIPNFNGMKYLEECLGSLRRQTGGSFETIVVDNGSSMEALSFFGILSGGSGDFSSGKYGVLQGGQ